MPIPHASRVSIDNFDDLEPVQTETIVIRLQSGSTFMRDADGRGPSRIADAIRIATKPVNALQERRAGGVRTFDGFNTLAQGI